MSEWISVKTQLPEQDHEDGNEEDKHVSILVDCWSSGSRIPDCRMIEGKWHYWTEYGDWSYDPHFEPMPAEPSHWMALPAPPSE